MQNAVIVGAGDIGQLVARKLLQHPEYGINLVGLVDRNPKKRRPDLHHLTLLGTPDELPQIVRTLSIERVIIAFSRDASDETVTLIRSLKDLEVQVDIVPRFFEAIGPKVDVHTLEGLPLLGLPPVVLSPSSRVIKRSVDLVGATIGLVITAPLFAVISCLIWLDSGRPVIFRQRRLGMGTKEFTIFKFRTMRQGTDDGAHRAAIEATMDPHAREADTGLYKADGNSAVTRVGAWLRKTSLDELPQLLNVLRGDMSLVGPAAEPAVRDRALRAASFRAVRGSAGPHGALAGDRPGTIDVARGDRDGRRLRARLVDRPGHLAPLPDPAPDAALEDALIRQQRFRSRRSLRPPTRSRPARAPGTSAARGARSPSAR